MNDYDVQAGTLQGSATEQPTNGKGVVGQENSTVQEKDAQAGAGAGSANNKKVSPKKDFKPKYEGKELEKIVEVTRILQQDITRIIADSGMGAVSFSGGSNCLIDLRKVHNRLCTPLVNRVHGVDQKKTGESLLSFGAQQVVIVVTVKAAKIAGLVSVRFGNDSNIGKPIQDDDFLVIDGNGRINFLMKLPVDEWPEIYAKFPAKDGNGYYNLSTIFDIINTNLSVWKTQDMVQKRLLIDGEEAHPGWSMIRILINKGYKYQAACHLVALATDRLTKTNVTTGDADEIFTHFSSAEVIYKTLLEVFGEDTDTLKTKTFTKEISVLWRKLQKGYGDKVATNHFVDFLIWLPKEKVKSIKEAKSVKGGTSKDEIRKSVINDEFSKFVEEHHLKID